MAGLLAAMQQHSSSRATGGLRSRETEGGGNIIAEREHQNQKMSLSVTLDIADYESIMEFIKDDASALRQRCNALFVEGSWTDEFGDGDIQPIFDRIVACIHQCQHLEMLHIDGNLNDDMISSIIQAFAGPKESSSISRLKSLKIVGSGAGRKTAIAISDLLTRNALYDLLTVNKSLVANDICRIAENSIQVNASLKRLNFSYIDLGDRVDDFDILMDALQQNAGIQELYLCGCNLGDREVESLSRLLCENNNIANLQLGKNELSKNGVMTFARRLPQMSGLRELNLLHCIHDVDKEGLDELLIGLRGNQSLRILYIDTGTLESYPQLALYPLLNQVGRAALLQWDNSSYRFPLGLWTKVILRITHNPAFEPKGNIVVKGLLESMSLREYKYHHSWTKIDVLYFMIRDLSPILSRFPNNE